jgi:hypothetical protein
MPYENKTKMKVQVVLYFITGVGHAFVVMSSKFYRFLKHAKSGHHNLNQNQ